MDYRNKLALAQYPDEEKLFVLQKDTLLSESEMFGEEVRSSAQENMMKRTFILYDEDGVDTENHAQKRYRAMVI